MGPEARPACPAGGRGRRRTLAAALSVGAVIAGLATAAAVSDTDPSPRPDRAAPSPADTTPPPLPPGLSDQQVERLSLPPGALGSPRGDRWWTLGVFDARWDPCTPVEFVLNPEKAPRGAVADFEAALYRVGQATGMGLEVVGTTGEADSEEWVEPGRPVLVTWGRPDGELLTRRAGGVGQAVAWQNYDGEKVYASGRMRFHTGLDWIYPPGFGARGSRVALYMHEVAHVLGLDHVPPRTRQLMEPSADERDFGAGDLAGLAEVTGGGCLRAPTGKDWDGIDTAGSTN